MRIGTLLISCALAFASLSVHAFERPFPADVKRGLMTPAHHPVVVVNEKTRTLSAGARIWNQDNMIEMPASLRGSQFAVNYTEDSNGDIDRIWILTADEAKQTPPKPVPLPVPLPAPIPAPASNFK